MRLYECCNNMVNRESNNNVIMQSDGIHPVTCDCKNIIKVTGVITLHGEFGQCDWVMYMTSTPIFCAVRLR
jgi:hypothetical protein